MITELEGKYLIRWEGNGHLYGTYAVTTIVAAPSPFHTTRPQALEKETAGIAIRAGAHRGFSNPCSWV